MVDDSELNIDNEIKNSKRKSGYSIASFVLSAAPLAILLMVFVFCLIVSVVIPDAGSVIWWLLIGAIPIFIPVAIITNTLSIIFGVKGLKGKKTGFAWAGIMIVPLEVLAVLVIWRLLL